MNGDYAAVSKLLCPMGSSHRLIRTASNKHGWPKNWPRLYPNGTLNFSNPSVCRSIAGIFYLSMLVFDPEFPFGSRGKKIYFGFVRSFCLANHGSENLSSTATHR